MKIGIIGDNHLTIQDPYSGIDPTSGFAIRTIDKFNSLREALEISKKEKVKLFVINGDLTEKMNPPEKLKDYFYDILIDYCQYFDIIILPGNHDGIQTSHNYMTEKLFSDKFGLSNLIIIDKITLLEKYPIDILIIPWTTDLDAINQALIDYGHDNAICIGHLEIIGAVSTTEHVLNLGIQAQRFSRFKAVFLNHYHKYQKVGKNIWYVGSSNIKDFSEIGLPKGFVIYDSVKNNHEFYQLEKRLFYEFLISEKTLDDVDQFLEEHSQDLQGSVIKLKIEGSKHWISEIRSEILKIFNEFKPLKILPKYTYL